MEESSLDWIFHFFGKLHPLVVHFPIGLLVIGLFIELFTIGGKRQNLRPGLNWIIYIGSISAIISALFGWLLRSFGDYSGDLVYFHQNMGIATAVLASVTALLLRYKMKNSSRSYIPYRLALTLTVIFLSITGHLGGDLTHGEGYLTNTFSEYQDIYDDKKSTELLSELKLVDSLSASQQDKLNLEVRAIFAHNCYQCHSKNKQQGGLSLDSKDGIFKGGDSGLALIAGNPEESEIYKRVILSPNDKGVMPKKGKVLKDDEIALIKLWVKNGAKWSDKELKIFPEAQLSLTKPKLPENTDENHPIDKLINTYFQKNGTDWPEIVDDKTFVRRVYLDIVGLLPEPEQIEQFISNINTDKRRILIDELLSDNQNYTQHWLSFWNDLLRNDYSGTGFITGGRKQITDWLYKSLEQNKPYDLMVKQLVNPSEASEGFIKGIKWRGVVNSSQRTEMQAAQNIGQSLMGINVKCASCHNSFVSNLTLEQSYGFATIFSDSLLELNRCDKPIGIMAKPNFLYSELGSVEAETVKERLLLLAEVMVKPENGRLYRTITNRIWKRLIGRGIIEPVDEMDNAAWNSELLDWLASDFVDSGYNLKHLMKMIMTSKAYQLPTIHYKKLESIKSEYVFKGPIPRRMSAEQFSDAVSQIIAPVYHNKEYNTEENKLRVEKIWHKKIDKKQTTDYLDSNKMYFRKTFILQEKEVIRAKVLVSINYPYALYINGNRVLKNSDWKPVNKLDISKFLQVGKTNLIAIEGANEDHITNSSGILFSMKIQYIDGNEQIINSDNSWKSVAYTPHIEWKTIEFNDDIWKHSQSIDSSFWGNWANFTFEKKEQKYIRASLVKQHPFMKALGRPSRENVTTSRDEQPTLLQALELTNGEYFNNVIKEGAELWFEKYGTNNEKIVETLYQKSFGRKPTDQEKVILLATLNSEQKKEALQDLFWATLILPEFQFIY